MADAMAFSLDCFQTGKRPVHFKCTISAIINHYYADISALDAILMKIIEKHKIFESVRLVGLTNTNLGEMSFNTEGTFPREDQRELCK